MIIAEFSSFRLIMVHIPKTAGIALRLSLRKHKDKARQWTEFMNISDGVDKTHTCLYSDYIQSYLLTNNLPLILVTSIRNPYDRIYSAFIFNQRTTHYKRNHLNNHPRIKWFRRPFLKFVKDELASWVNQYREIVNRREDMNPVGIHFAPMTFFLIKRPYKIATQYFIRQESLDQDIKGFCQAVGWPPVDSVICHCARAERPTTIYQYLKHYDQPALEIINDLYDDDFKYFGYTKLTQLHLV